MALTKIPILDDLTQYHQKIMFRIAFSKIQLLDPCFTLKTLQMIFLWTLLRRLCLFVETLKDHLHLDRASQKTPCKPDLIHLSRKRDWSPKSKGLAAVDAYGAAETLVYKPKPENIRDFDNSENSLHY